MTIRRFVVEEFRFELAGFREASTQILADVSGPRATFGIAITRAPLGERDLGTYVDEQVEIQRKSFDGLVVLEKLRTTKAQRRCADVKIRSRVPGAMLYHRILVFEWAGSAVMFTMTAPMRLKEKADRHLMAVVDSIRFRKEPVATP